MKLSARAALERYRKIDYMRFFYEDSLAHWLCKSNIVIVIAMKWSNHFWNYDYTLAEGILMLERRLQGYLEDISGYINYIYSD